MKFTKKQKNRLSQMLKVKPLSEIAEEFAISESELIDYLHMRKTTKEIKSVKSSDHTRKNNRFLPKNIFSFIQNPWFHIAIFCLLIIISYVNSLQNEFISDDVRAIVDDRRLGTAEYITRAFPFIGRPLVIFSIAKLGGIVPVWFRLSTIFFHAGVTILLYLIGRIVIKKDSIAFIAGSLYAIHPVFTEVVVWISGGIYAQYAFFSLLCLYMFILYTKKKSNLCLLISLIAMVVAFSTETKAVILPVLLIWYLISFKLVKKYWKFLGILFGVFAVVAILLFPQIQNRINAYDSVAFQGTAFVNPLSIPAAMISYLRLLFLPIGLTFYHEGWNLSNINGLFYFSTIFVLLYILWYGWKKDRILMFFFGFFIISLLPVMLPLNVYAWGAERYVYLGGAGIIMLQAYYLSKIADRFAENKELIIGIILLLVIPIFVWLTISRNKEWKNETTFAASVAETSGDNTLTHNNLGLQHLKNERYEQAIEEFDRALAINPKYADAYLNKAVVLNKLEQTDEAMKNLEKAVEILPDCWECHFNLGVLYRAQNDLSKAIEEIEKAVAVQDGEPQLFINLAVLYLESGEVEKARPPLEKALKLEPNKDVQMLLDNLDNPEFFAPVIQEAK